MNLVSSVPDSRDLALRHPTVPTGRPIYVALGMHRSGTSLLAQILHYLGVDMATDSKGDRHNPDGYWERWEIIGISNKILAHIGRPWGTPSHGLPLPAGWWRDPALRPLRQELVDFLAKSLGENSKPWGFKDPRTCRLLPLWLEIFEELNLSPIFILAVRDPREVSQSLKARDGFDEDYAENLWLTYHFDIFRTLGKTLDCVVRYDALLEFPFQEVTRLRSQLELPWHGDETSLEDLAQRLIKADLHRSRPVAARAAIPLAGWLFDQIKAIDSETDWSAQLSSVLRQLHIFERFARPLFARLEAFDKFSGRRSPEEVARAIAALEDRSREILDLQAAAKVHEETLGAMDQRLRQSETLRDAAEQQTRKIEQEKAKTEREFADAKEAKMIMAMGLAETESKLKEQSRTQGLSLQNARNTLLAILPVLSEASLTQNALQALSERLGFDEAAYLAHNPDVLASVREGIIPSGWHHWLKGGYAESREAIFRSLPTTAETVLP